MRHILYKYLTGASLIALTFSLNTGTANATCSAMPTCEELGYTETSCSSGYAAIKCPFDTTKMMCILSSTATCAELGYTSSSCQAGWVDLKCPFDKTKHMCPIDACSGYPLEFCYGELGESELCPISPARCKFTSCNAIDPGGHYIQVLDNGDCREVSNAEDCVKAGFTLMSDSIPDSISNNKYYFLEGCPLGSSNPYSNRVVCTMSCHTYDPTIGDCVVDSSQCSVGEPFKLYFESYNTILYLGVIVETGSDYVKIASLKDHYAGPMPFAFNSPNFSLLEKVSSPNGDIKGRQHTDYLINTGNIGLFYAFDKAHSFQLTSSDSALDYPFSGYNPSPDTKIDWYLPSVGEMDLITGNSNAGSGIIGALEHAGWNNPYSSTGSDSVTNKTYWTSTVYTSGGSSYIRTWRKNQSGNISTNDETSTSSMSVEYYVRPFAIIR